MAVLMLSTAVIGCSDSGTDAATTAPSGPDSPAPSSAADTEPAVTVRLDEYGREYVPDELPDANLNNREFTVHTRGNVQQYEWEATEQNGQTLKDAWTSQMLDLMYDTVVFDFANTYNGSIGIVNSIKECVGSASNSFAAAYKAAEESAQRKLKDLISKVRDVAKD